VEEILRAHQSIPVVVVVVRVHLEQMVQVQMVVQGGQVLHHL
jgi:hypothetical protein